MTIKKILSYILMILVVIITVIALLAIWDIIDLRDVVGKTFKSLFFIFLSSVVILFIFGVVLGKEHRSGE